LVGTLGGWVLDIDFFQVKENRAEGGIGNITRFGVDPLSNNKTRYRSTDAGLRQLAMSKNPKPRSVGSWSEEFQRVLPPDRQNGVRPLRRPGMGRSVSKTLAGIMPSDAAHFIIRTIRFIFRDHCISAKTLLEQVLTYCFEMAAAEFRGWSASVKFLDRCKGLCDPVPLGGRGRAVVVYGVSKLLSHDHGQGMRVLGSVKCTAAPAGQILGDHAIVLKLAGSCAMRPRELISTIGRPARSHACGISGECWSNVASEHLAC
jgi:hypothetical protein